MSKKLKNFVNNLITIVKREDIPISYCIDDNNNYFLIIDDKKYIFSRDRDYLFAGSYLSITDLSTDEVESNIKVPIIYYWKVIFLHKKQIRVENRKYKKNVINNLPDLSDVGRSAKKYNL